MGIILAVIAIVGFTVGIKGVVDANDKKPTKTEQSQAERLDPEQK
jgi:hypothetical protein